MKLDLHIHTKYSKDCRLDLGEILKAAKGRVDAIAITDHDTIEGALLARKMAGDGDIKVIVGVEVKTDMGEVLGYGVEEEIAEREFWSVIDAIKGQGGIVGLPHPFDALRRYTLRPSGEVARALDFVEVFNGRCLRASFNENAMKYGKEHGLGATAGSDAHTLGEVGKAGVVTDSLELRELIKSGVTFGETHPLALLRTKINKIIHF